ncbi:S6 family peptidase [Achromobacter xylosoxidans]|uniref:S6 family peptidase n=1 Tax=Alcaligenes xylosoxydans xylosoxydans TaxID=85698 RepID=UPI0022B9094B|nr:S6 family peptidase [Achromobacter xylosoxidans]MCZ8393083.1 autotransporter outer membrane beta-barrel domain-containing protein [Achromobacter xylosoxidans]
MSLLTMNKIYSLKYNHQNQPVAVSEICRARRRGSTTGATRRVRGRGARAMLAAALPPLAAALFPGAAGASYVSIDIPYQTYRDFAENKGAFQPGALGVPIHDKSGALRGRLSDVIPFIDFSSVSSGRATETLIAPQYAVGAAHVGELVGTSFAHQAYSLIRQDVHPDYIEGSWGTEWDFNINRLGKLVTDVAPIATFPVPRTSTPLELMGDQDNWTEEEKKKFPLFYRVGMGNQYVGNHPEVGYVMQDGQPMPEGFHKVGGPYKWAIGGIVTPIQSNETFIRARPDHLLPSVTQLGDSGSPLFAWDAEHEQWVIAGVTSRGFPGDLSTGELGSTYWAHVFHDFIADVVNKDNDPEITFAQGKGPLLWSFDSATGVGKLTQQDREFVMHGYKKTPGLSYADGNSARDFAGLDAGKNLSFRAENGTGEITLRHSVNQGAGALTFHDSFIVSPADNQTWMGGGIDVKENATVVWNVNGVAGDNLHKIGRGTLTVAGKGVNLGGLKVGDGKVILSQRPGDDGKVQAFDHITLSSGRPEVVLGDSGQVNPNHIKWVARGGVLDINGNDIAFNNQLPGNARDHGATIANNSGKKATVTVNLEPLAPKEVSDYIYMMSSMRTGTRGNLYKKGLGFFVLKQDSFLPILDSATTTSNQYWEYVGTNLDDALAKANEFTRMYFPTQRDFVFTGTLKGNIDASIVNPSGTSFIVDGDIDIPKGSFSQGQGELVFQGHPVIHAINTPEDAQKLLALGDDSLKTQSVSFDQPDWESRNFTLGDLKLADATFRLARNATLLGDIDARRARVILGSPLLYIDKNDGGRLGQEPERGTSVASADADKSRYQGKVSLKENATLEIRERFAGAIDAGNSAITVLSDQAALTGQSRFSGSALVLERGAHLKASGGWYDDGAITVADGAALTLSGAPAGPAHYFTQTIVLQGDNANLRLAPGSHSFSDLSSPAASRVTLGPSTAADAPQTVYAGSVNAAQASMSIQDNAHWIVTGDSTLKQLQASKALLSFDDMDRTRSGFMARAQSAPAVAGNSPPTTIQPAHALTIDTAALWDSTLAFRVDPYGGDHDRLTVATELSGGGNRLRITDFGDRPATAAPRAREDLLLSAPSSAPANLFQLEQAYTDGATDAATDGSRWLGGLAVSHDADLRQWWFLSMRNDAPWRLGQDRQFDALHLPAGGRVELSQPQADWTPRTLQTDTLTASGVHFALTARPQTGESDSIRISTLAQGGDNSLDLTLLVQNPVPDSDNGSLLLASAPLTTADGYFKPGSITQGLTIYVPNVEIVSTDTQKKWQLAYKKADDDVITPPVPPADSSDAPVDTPPTADATPPMADATPPMADATPPIADTTPPMADTTPPMADVTPPADTPPPPAATDAPVSPPPGAIQPGTSGLSLFTPFALKLSELDTLQSHEKIADRLAQAGIAADDGTIREVTQLRRQIMRSSTLASLPRVSFVLETNQLDKRLGDVRQLNEDAGLWIKTSHGRADYQQIRLKHTTLQFGLDRKQGRHLYGIMGSYTQGSGQGEGQLSERHTTGGIGLYYALIHEDGPFVDVIAKYLKTTHAYQFPSQLNIGAQGARSTSLLASVQAGWRQNLFNGGAFVEPSVEVVAGTTSGYTLEGDKGSVGVRVNASRPVYAKIGATVGLNLQSDEQHALALSAGLFRLQNLRRGGSIDIVNNSRPDDVLRNPMADDSRYLVNLSLNARLSANWRLYSQVESSFAGRLKHDYNGQIGVRYQF